MSIVRVNGRPKEPIPKTQEEKIQELTVELEAARRDNITSLLALTEVYEALLSVQAEIEILKNGGQT
jgi:hypothetical protein